MNVDGEEEEERMEASHAMNWHVEDFAPFSS